jgi:hypothetical protein
MYRIIDEADKIEGYNFYVKSFSHKEQGTPGEILAEIFITF